jgi:TonB family protein
MSRQNKLRFLFFLLFSAVAHSGVLIASLFMHPSIQEEAVGLTEKLSVDSQVDAKPLGVLIAQNSRQMPTVLPSKKKISESTLELVDAPKAQAMPDKEILLAQQDDPRAIEIEKPKPKIKKQAVVSPKKKIAKQKKLKKLNPANENISDEKPVVVKEKVDAEQSDVIVDEREAPVVVSAPIVVNESQTEPEAEPALPAAQAPSKALTQDKQASQIQGDGEGDESTGELAGGSITGIRDGDSLAEVNGNRRPSYPLEDRRARREGTAVFTAHVTAEGRVQDIKLESSATPAMNAAAQKAFANYKYRTGQEGWVRKKFVFKISGESEESGGLRRSLPKNTEKTSDKNPDKNSNKNSERNS